MATVSWINNTCEGYSEYTRNSHRKMVFSKIEVEVGKEYKHIDMAK
jgi:hypothetical protein